VVEGTSASSRLPRRQPTSTPSPMPTTKLITVAVPTRMTVHPIACRITVETGTGNS
jgi:hypothetical protein